MEPWLMKYPKAAERLGITIAELDHLVDGHQVRICLGNNRGNFMVRVDDIEKLLSDGYRLQAALNNATQVEKYRIRNGRQSLTVANGKTVWGAKPSHGDLTGEAFYRDNLAHYVGGLIEVDLKPFGRCDVLTDKRVWEVKQVNSWSHGIRQVFGYARATGNKPQLAVFGQPYHPREWQQIFGNVSEYGIGLWIIRKGEWMQLSRWTLAAINSETNA